MIITLCGKRWNFRFAPNLKNDGDCDDPNKPGKEIRIDSQLAGQDQLETIVHELMHGCLFSLSEEFVTQSSHDIAAALWRLGYRKCE